MRWLVKTEPDSYSFTDLVAEGRTEWTGIRNHTAANHLRAMAVGDDVLIYHSGKEKAAVGTATVARAAQPDGDEGWVSTSLAADVPLARPVTLALMKADPALADMAMIRQSRLSVSPITDTEWSVILRLAKG
ncbi:ubiquinol-cytochrome C reductase [Sphingomonas sp. Leaf339]|uniref:EVE domain-containing protein n=1 Tax=Sphingomonas sp. Leaf339 TaxID=1736343 RepID=UPI0006F4E660|nr:EVE domain-containing protein [Sphingomonas sp. Leaf339]KQU53076.1 ubiquinol-cytochrome C reductase [Sphingomonas sp. Leaf339]